MRSADPHLDALIRPLIETDYVGINTIIASLPEWFDERARTISIPIDIQHQRGFVAVQKGTIIVGFITLFVAEGRLNIGWLRVQQGLHQWARTVVAIQVTRDLGLRKLATYTLGDGVEYEPYKRTRWSYFENGFQIYQRSQNLACPNQGC